MVPKVKVLIFLLGLTGIFVFMKGRMTGYMTQRPQLLDQYICACESCSAEDDEGWFLQRFNKSVEPFLTAKYTLPEEAFQWWKVCGKKKTDLKQYN